MTTEVEVDMTNVRDFDRGDTTYYAGTVKVGSREKSVDHCTDRSTTVVDVVEELVREALEIPEDALEDELSDELIDLCSGRKYSVEFDDEKQTVTVVDLTEQQDFRPVIWRVHAEKIAEDVVERLSSECLLGPAVKLMRDQILIAVVAAVTDTMEMVEDVEEVPR